MQELSNKIGNNQYATLKTTCMDCGKDFDLTLERIGPEKIKIENGIIGKRDDDYLFKCNDCWKIDKNFGNKTEVYSRVVGYLRPISHWNAAKQEEFSIRKTYEVA